MPSRRLLRTALVNGEYAMHIVGELGDNAFTMSRPLDWEFCVPMTAESCIGWCLYVSGSGGRDDNNLITAEMLKGDLCFTRNTLAD